MKSRLILSTLLIVVLALFSCKTDNKTTSGQRNKSSAQKQAWAIVIHGGAGGMTRENTTPEIDKEYRESLLIALSAGKKVLSDGGSALDAVEQTIRIMEDNPLFNAGKGAVFTHEGRNELDAAIMDGSNLAAGAVAGVTDIKNPITAARRVMTNSPHVMLAARPRPSQG